MRLSMTRFCVMITLSCLSFLASCSDLSAETQAILPLDLIQPGMRGVGRTVFEGDRIDEFSVEIIGVVRNIRPKQSLILAKLEGGPLARTGVVAGMSGSPVLIDDKLIGAIAYSFPFAKDAIAGITPIAEMLDSTAIMPAQKISRSLSLSSERSSLQRTLNFERLAQALKRYVPSIDIADTHLNSDLIGSPHCRSLELPLVFSGFDPSAFEWARNVFSGLGFVPIAGSGAIPKTTDAGIQPGGAVGLSLVEGDLDLTVTGTITHIDGDRVYAFGHPFYNLGSTQLPMKRATVFSVVPSLQQSWRIDATGESIGTFDQDRSTVVVGRLGQTPRLMPVNVRFRTSLGHDMRYSFRIVEDELLSPLLTYMTLFSVLQANERALGVSTVSLNARIALGRHGVIVVDDLITTNQSAPEAASLVATPLAVLLANEFEHLRAEGIEVDIEAQETLRTARIERAWLDHGDPAHPGERRWLRIQLRTYRGDSVVETVPVDLPADLRPGVHALRVMDSVEITRFEAQVLRRGFAPRNLEQVIRAINLIHRGNRLHVRLVNATKGAVVAGEPMPNLPPSVMNVLNGKSHEANLILLQNAVVWAADIATAYAIQGQVTLQLRIEK
jgi:hypothetical protein